MSNGIQVALQVNITYECIMLMGNLQRKKGRFTYDELAQGLSQRMHLSLPEAHRAVVGVVAKIDKLLASNFEDGSAKFREPPPPTIEQTIDGWKRMMAELSTQRPH